MNTLDRLKETGTSIKQCDDQRAELVAARTELVAKARSEGHTWREIAELLGMTQHGLIKAQDKQTKGAKK